MRGELENETEEASGNMTTGPDEAEKTLRRAMDLIAEHLRVLNDPAAPVTDRLSPDQLADSMDLTLSEDGTALEGLLPVIESYLRHSVKTGSRKFLNQLFSGIDMAGVLGEIVTAVTNTSMYTYEVAPVATVMEQDLVRRMARIVGFHGGEGIFVNGGSNANMVAMLCARHRADANIKDEGLRGLRLEAFVSDQAHYSFLTAANVLGIGARSVVRIESDSLGRMVPEKLEEAMNRSRLAGRTPFFVAATAGTTVLGAFDPVREIADIAKRHGAWLHIDGAWGAPVLFSETHRELLAGHELADSFAWDAHKLMGVPLLCTALLVRDTGSLVSTCCPTEGTDYIYHDNPEESRDLGPMSLQCGRRVDVLKLWLAWKHNGEKGYADRIDRLMKVTTAARERVDAEPSLEMMAEPTFLNLCFRYNPSGNADNATVDRLNIAIRDRLAASGDALVNYAYIGDRVTIRLVIAHPDLMKDDLDSLLEKIVALGKECESAMLAGSSS